MNEEIDLQKLQKLKDDLPYFATNFLKIKTKNHGIINFKMSNIQIDAHNRIEERKKQGKPCKIIFLKSRQVGMSTYTEARFFSKTLFNKAKNAFVLADKTDSADNIFKMTKLYLDELPDGLKIPLEKDSTSELQFSTKSSFRVGTAGSKAVGRSMTINYFHGSEVAFWNNANDIVSGMLQTIPDNLDSELILESTANGTSGNGAYFYTMVNAGLDKNSDFLTLFYAWYQQNEYRRNVSVRNGEIFPVGSDEPVKWNDEELELKRLYKLDNEQLMWRRAKLLSDFKGREYLFKQEYPSSIQEAFITTSNALIPLNYIEASRINYHLAGDGLPIIIGIDPARSSDRTIITIRQGRVVQKFYRFDKMDNVRLAGIVLRLIQAINPARVFIDYGHGTGVYDILISQGVGSIVELVQFGSSAYDNRKYANRRAEMYDKMRSWYMQEGGVYIKDQEYIEEFVRDISIIPDLKVSDSNGRYSLEKKENIVKGTEIHSTDFADSLALTFASPVSYTPKEFGYNNKIQTVNKNWQQRL
jgi:hypothetical protein